MIFIPVLTLATYSAQRLKTGIKAQEKYVKLTDDGHGVKLQLEQKKLFVYFLQRSRGVGKTPPRRAADQNFGRSEGTGCWAELLGRRESRRGFEQPQKLNTWRQQEITDQQLSITFTELRYPLLRKGYAPKIIRLLQDSVPKQKKFTIWLLLSSLRLYSHFR
jgi:hypothetical protein